MRDDDEEEEDEEEKSVLLRSGRRIRGWDLDAVSDEVLEGLRWDRSRSVVAWICFAVMAERFSGGRFGLLWRDCSEVAGAGGPSSSSMWQSLWALSC